MQTEVQRYASSHHMSPKVHLTRNKRGIKNLRSEKKFLLRIGELCGLLTDVDCTLYNSYGFDAAC